MPRAERVASVRAVLYPYKGYTPDELFSTPQAAQRAAQKHLDRLNPPVQIDFHKLRMKDVEQLRRRHNENH